MSTLRETVNIFRKNITAVENAMRSTNSRIVISSAEELNLHTYNLTTWTQDYPDLSFVFIFTAKDYGIVSMSAYSLFIHDEDVMRGTTYETTIICEDIAMISDIVRHMLKASEILSAEKI